MSLTTVFCDVERSKYSVNWFYSQRIVCTYRLFLATQKALFEYQHFQWITSSTVVINNGDSSFPQFRGNSDK